METSRPLDPSRCSSVPTAGARRRVVAATVTAAALALLATLPCAATAAQTAEGCLSRQLSASAKFCRGVAQCHAVALKAGAAVDGNCLFAAEESVELVFEFIEDPGACLVEDGGFAPEDVFEETLDEIALALTPRGGACAAKKMRASGRRCAAMLKCDATSARTGQAVSTECVAKASVKFDAAVAGAEAAGGCATTGDGPALASTVDRAVSRLHAYFQGLPSTTTTTTTTTLDTTTTTETPAAARP